MVGHYRRLPEHAGRASAHCAARPCCFLSSGLLLTVVLVAARVRGALLWGILATASGGIASWSCALSWNFGTDSIADAHAV